MKKLLIFTLLCVNAFAQTTSVGGSRVVTGTVNYAGTSTGSSNAYVVSLGIGGLVQGQALSFTPNFTNTGSATLNVDGVGAKAIKLSNGSSDVPAGALTLGTIVNVVYDGTSFELAGSSSGSDSVSPTGTVNGIPVQELVSVADVGLGNWQAALNNARNQVVNVVLFTDSIGVCYGPPCGSQGPSSSAGRYTDQIRAYLDSQNLSHGTGLVPVQVSVSGNVVNSDFWATSGTWNQSNILGPTQATSTGQTGSALIQMTSGATATFATQRWDHLNVYCARTSSSTGFSVTIDGTGVGTACGTTAGSPTATVATFAAPALGFHTAVLTAQGNNSYLYGAEGTIGTSGISLHLEGQAGAVVEMFGTSPSSQEAFTDIIPGGTQLAVVTLGTNEPISGVSTSTYQASMTALAAHEKGLSSNPSVLIWSEPPYGYEPFATQVVAYWAIAKQLAAQNSYAYMATIDRWGSYGQAVTNGFIQGDTVHPTLAGTSDLRAMLGKMIFGFDPVMFGGGTDGLNVTTSNNFPQLQISGIPSYVFGVASLGFNSGDHTADWRWYSWGTSAGQFADRMLQVVNGKTDVAPFSIAYGAPDKTLVLTANGPAPGDQSTVTCAAGGEGALSYTKGSGSTTGALKICENVNGTYQWVSAGSGGGSNTVGGTSTFPQFTVQGTTGYISGVAGSQLISGDNNGIWRQYAWGTGSGIFDRSLQIVNGKTDVAPMTFQYAAPDKSLVLTSGGPAPGDQSGITCATDSEGALSYTKGSGSTTGTLKVCQNQNGSYQWVTYANTAASFNGGTIGNALNVTASNSFPQLLVHGVTGYVSGVSATQQVSGDGTADWRWYVWGSGQSGLLQLVNGINDVSPLKVFGDAVDSSVVFGHAGMMIGDNSAKSCDSGSEGATSYIHGSGGTNGTFQICQNQSGSYQWVTH